MNQADIWSDTKASSVEEEDFCIFLVTDTLSPLCSSRNS